MLQLLVSTLAHFAWHFAIGYHLRSPLSNVAVQGAATELAVNNEWISERAQCPPPIDLKTICASLRWKAIWNHFCVRVFSAIQFRERHLWYTPLPLDVLAS